MKGFELTRTISGERAVQGEFAKQGFGKTSIVCADGNINLIGDMMNSMGGATMQMGTSRGQSASLGLN